jgi:hypothetical protein
MSAFLLVDNGRLSGFRCGERAFRNRALIVTILEGASALAVGPKSRVLANCADDGRAPVASWSEPRQERERNSCSVGRKDLEWPSSFILVLPKKNVSVFRGTRSHARRG